MRYKIAVCDDEQNQLEQISALVREWSARAGCVCEIQTFLSAEVFLFSYEEEKDYDILLLDVEMKEISGVELARRLRHDKNRAEIVFITSHFEFFGEGYEVDALHYLMKPITQEKLMPVLSKAAERRAAEPNSLILTCEGETIRLYESDILYVEAFRHYIIIHMGQEECRIKESISAFSEKLSGDFYRTHRSCLVSLKHIVRISRTEVLLDDGTRLPLARGKYDDINRAFIERN